LVLLAEPLAAACFEYGRFSAADTQQTARMIAAYGLAVWAYCGLLIVQRGFYALGDRMTPLYVGFGAFGLNVVLNLTLVWWLGGTGLAVATAVAAMMQCVVTGWLMERRLGGMEFAAVGGAVGKALVSTAAMLIAGWITLSSFGAMPGLSGRGLRILGPLAVSLLVYFAVAALVRFREPLELIRLWRREEPVSTIGIEE
jgi:putative peptidoglycan lipid II flippase